VIDSGRGCIELSALKPKKRKKIQQFSYYEQKKFTLRLLLQVIGFKKNEKS
jgi:hypothetical protein